MKGKYESRVLIFDVGAFVHGIAQVLKEKGAHVSVYLLRDYGHYGPKCGAHEVYDKRDYPNPCDLIKKGGFDFVVTRSLYWALQDWTEEFISMGVPILCPYGESFMIEREREYAHKLCDEYNIPYPKSFLASNKLEAEKILKENPVPYVLKNTLCDSTSPIRTTVCETIEDTKTWLENLDFREGVFMQEYLGTKEVGHIAFVSNGKIYSVLTNQEYNRAFDGNMGKVAGAPMGGLVEVDKDDKYGIVKDLLDPLLPWFKKVNFHGPIQITAMWNNKKWNVLEYNIRLGVTCGLPIMRMLKDPITVFKQVAKNEDVSLEFEEGNNCGCVLTLAGHGYPFTEIQAPKFKVNVKEELDCDLWWNEVDEDENGDLFVNGHRVAEIVGMGRTMDEAIKKAYSNISKISCPDSYYRTDIGETLWPPVYN